MPPQQRRTQPPPRRGKTPADRAAEADAVQRRLKQEAADRRAAKADEKKDPPEA
jgi:hypothetical protein